MPNPCPLALPLKVGVMAIPVPSRGGPLCLKGADGQQISSIEQFDEILRRVNAYDELVEALKIIGNSEGHQFAVDIARGALTASRPAAKEETDGRS